VLLKEVVEPLEHQALLRMSKSKHQNVAVHAVYKMQRIVLFTGFIIIACFTYKIRMLHPS
jgi:preprotein translocase subunit Sec63